MRESSKDAGGADAVLEHRDSSLASVRKLSRQISVWAETNKALSLYGRWVNMMHRAGNKVHDDKLTQRDKLKYQTEARMLSDWPQISASLEAPAGTTLTPEASGALLKWFLQQEIFVKVNNEYSRSVQVRLGVTEGGVFSPLLFPASRAIGIHDIHYAMVVVIAMGLGLFAPPLGIGYYSA